MKQERAHQTHRALLRAAAAEFDEHGYAGTSLARVSQAAGVTMGALTFHFPSKAALADAVRADAAALTRAAVDPDPGRTPPREEGVAELTDTLTRLLQEEPSVRAAARLTWEQPESAGNWHAGWSPDLRDRLARERAGAARPAATKPAAAQPATTQPAAAESGDLDALDSLDLETLAHCLVVGSEALRRGVITLGGGAPVSEEETRRRLRRLWRRALAGPPAPGGPA
ncbi:TetR family transcriptional regulator [Streptomyces sp. BE303]|uniref:TetR family transcriptional regulator n=1 Tax=Streptomyces sp. BE303 TaxID=3002528 RepID=UPI002E771DC9|nr:TetR family transcriptional regulator [Streptomyces sp. BE303]MED7948271.1 TetR family transcriptional regulator [Streptomyces sp. BE303]